MAREGTEAELRRAERIGRRLGVGCFTLITGGASGGMIFMLVGMAIAFFKREPKCDGVPLCEWYAWFFPGVLTGALSLTAFVQLRLGKRDAQPMNTDRG